MKNLRYLLAIIPGLLAIVGNVYGGNYVYINMIYNMVGMVALDWLLKSNTSAITENESDTLPNMVLVLAVVVFLGGISTLLYGAYSQVLEGHYLWIAAFSTAIYSGIGGIIVAHELIHRKEKYWQNIGILNMILVNYSHFYIEHIKGHHRWVGTLRDPASARYNESIYAFFWRGIPGQFISAYNIEAQRLAKLDKSGFSLQNFIVRSTVLQVLIMGILFYISSTLGIVYVVHSITAIIFLEYVNYIEHYGLSREENDKYNVTHAWQSDVTTSRYSLVELSRHSDHHLKASKPYHTLESHAESPVLPAGYFGLFYVAFLPKWWFGLMNPIIDEMKED